MARDSVMLNGVSISRAQYDELTAKFKEPEALRPGEVVLFLHSEMWPRIVNADGRTCTTEKGERSRLDTSDAYARVGMFSEIVAFYRQHHPEGK